MGQQATTERKINNSWHPGMFIINNIDCVMTDMTNNLTSRTAPVSLLAGKDTGL
jgi:hypothetical protein